jgi:[acyl-carrier-protein] S-malonyltransferase
MKTCLVFPGQGAQYPGMGQDLYEASEAVQELFTLAAETTGIDVKALLFEGSEEELKKTENTQVAITLVNLAVAEFLGEKGIVAQGAAGFSLGEYSALVYTGVLSAKDVFPLVKLRGELMAKACESLDQSSGAPGMAAVIGLAPEAVDQALAEAAIQGVYGANYNSPVQVVISGTASGLQGATEVLKAAGAKRVLPLKVSGPFHSPLLQGAAEDLKVALDSVSFQDPVKALYSNVTGKEITSGAEAKSLAVQQVVSPVRWTEEEALLVAAGYQRLIEAGPGTVLTGLWKKFNAEISCLSAGKLEQINAILES